MTKIFFVRHAKSDFSIKDDLVRSLTQDGSNDSKKVAEFLLNKDITRIYSSPYKEAIDTIRDFAEILNLKINIIDDLRERRIDSI